MCHIFIQSSVNGHLGCFHVLAILSSAAVVIGVRVSFQIMFFSRYMPRSGIARSYSSSIFFFFFLKNLHTVLHNAYTIYIPTNSVRGFPFLHTFWDSFWWILRKTPRLVRLKYAEVIMPTTKSSLKGVSVKPQDYFFEIFLPPKGLLTIRHSSHYWMMCG